MESHTDALSGTRLMTSRTHHRLLEIPVLWYKSGYRVQYNTIAGTIRYRVGVWYWSYQHDTPNNVPVLPCPVQPLEQTHQQKENERLPYPKLPTVQYSIPLLFIIMSGDYASRLKEYKNKGICGLAENCETKRSLEKKLQQLVELIQSASKIVVLT